MNNENYNFSSITCSLSGKQMVEAAAGTGKTYNIQNLVVRLLLEYPLADGDMESPKAITIDQILVVTFTKAATAELSDRIRKILRCTLAEVKGRDYPEKADEHNRIQELLEHAGNEIRKCSAGNPDANAINTAVKQRLKKALVNFDSNMISTIHSFCQRILVENAFNCDILFNSEILEKPDDILYDIQMDFFRKEFYAPEYAGIRTCFQKSFKPDSYKQLISYRRNHPEIHFISGGKEYQLKQNGQGVELVTVNENENDPPVTLKTIFETAVKALKSYEEGLLNFPVAMNAEYGSSDKMKKCETLLLDAQKDDTQINIEILETLLLFAKDKIEGKITQSRKKKPEEKAMENALNKEKLNAYLNKTFFNGISDLQKQTDAYKALLPIKKLHYVLDEFEKRKLKENFQTHDDLINRVYDRICKSQNFVKHIREKLKVAIVDEFQDTDGRQYGIFNTIFEKALFMVGDPRQAIYGFRGGDVATCNMAKKSLPDRPWELATNYRSSGQMIAAVNRLFHEFTYSFADKEFTLPEVKSKEDAPAYEYDGKPVPNPMRFTWLTKNGEATGKTNLKSAAMDACVKKIYSMLMDRKIKVPRKNGSGLPGNLLPGDIAVLVDVNAEAQDIKEKLAEYNIPAVISKAVNVFDSKMAEELETVLNAIADPAGSSAVRRAMCTGIMGYSPADLVKYKLTGSNPEVEAIQNCFFELRDKWLKNSFIEMFQTLLNRNDVNRGERGEIRTRLLEKINGERYLTDLLQLRDVLSAESRKKRLTISGTLNFLKRQRNKELRNETAEYETLLETDRDAVTIMTIHSSKGLEFPFVFLPTMFARTAKKWKEDRPGTYHNENNQIVCNLEQTGENIIFGEGLQENLRLAYVALTRAKFYCHVFWGDVSTSGNDKNSRAGALDWLFRMREALDQKTEEERNEILKLENLIEKLQNADGDSPKKLLENWGWLEPEETKQEITGVYTPDTAKDDPMNLKPQTWQGAIDRTWKISSFSNLTNDEHDSDGKDLDAGKAETEDDANSRNREGIFAVKGSAQVGSAWHDIFEKADFQNPGNLKELAEQSLKKFGIIKRNASGNDDSIVQLTADMVREVLCVKLKNNDGGEFSLSDISWNNRLSELEFCYQLRNAVSKSKLQNALKKYVSDHFAAPGWKLNDDLISGYLMGFIDLIFVHNGKFYIVDWKSNIIGGKPESFNQNGIRDEIFKHLYFLQYLIYSVALMKYLKLKTGKTDIEELYRGYYGGVYYLFVRGMNKDTPENGVWYAKPDWKLLETLDDIIG